MKFVTGMEMIGKAAMTVDTEGALLELYGSHGWDQPGPSKG